jgi:hypothetical protein
MWLRTRFLASHAKTATTDRQKRYFSTGVLMEMPKTDRLATVTEPEADSLVNHLMRRNAQSQKNWAASVATARYRPLIRRLGMPNRTPAIIAKTPPSKIAASVGMPSIRTYRL